MPGSKPGERRGGRQKGTPNKATAARQAEIAATGETPLDYMLRVMRDPTQEHSRRDDMARAVAPYVHPKLQATTVSGPEGGPIEITELSEAELARRAAFLLTSAAKAKK